MKAKIGYIRNNRYDVNDDTDREETSAKEFKPKLNRYDDEYCWTKIVYWEVEND